MTDTTIDTKFKLEGIDGAIATVQAFGNAFEPLPPGFEVSRVKLQDDEAIVEMAALAISNQMYLTPLEGWCDTIADHKHQIECSKIARRVLALVDDLQGQRVFKVTMPKPTDDGATLRAMFGGERIVQREDGTEDRS